MNKEKLEQLITLLKEFRDWQDEENGKSILCASSTELAVKIYDIVTDDLDKVEFVIRWANAKRLACQ